VQYVQQTIAPPLRSVFSRGDAWLSTDTLFTRDEDGDHWLVDGLAALLRRDGVAVPSMPIVRALSRLDAVDLVVTYAVDAQTGQGPDSVVVAAASLRSGQQVTAEDVGRVLSAVPADQQPDVVRIVPEIPLSDWHRPIPGRLPQDGLGRATKLCPVWYRDEETGRYRLLTKATRNHLLGAVS
jgi:putative long chain acyl-CoA synthase